MDLFDFNDGNGPVAASRFVEKDGTEHGWVSGDSQVKFNGFVTKRALVYGHSVISGNAVVSMKARVYDNSWVYGNASVYGSATVRMKSIVYQNAQVYGNAVVSNCFLAGDAKVCGNVILSDAHVGQSILIDDRGWTWDGEDPPSLESQSALARELLVHFDSESPYSAKNIIIAFCKMFYNGGVDSRKVIKYALQNIPWMAPYFARAQLAHIKLEELARLTEEEEV